MRRPMRPRSVIVLAVLVLAVLVLAAGCDATVSSTSPTLDPSPTLAGPLVSATTEPTPSPTPALPASVPPSFDDDVTAADVPAAALIPLRTEVTGSWTATTSQGEAIVVAWLVPGTDPLRLDRGLAVWRRFADGGAPWRPVFGASYQKRTGVLGIDAFIADVTADGSDDALVVAATGGSGGCALASVIDVGAGTQVFERQICDGVVLPSPGEGLVIDEAVFEPGDPHCCPSARRITVLTYDASGDWVVADETVTPLS